MNSLIINPQIHQITTNTPKELHRIDLKEDNCIGDQKRQTKPSSYFYGPVGLVGNAHTSAWR